VDPKSVPMDAWDRAPWNRWSFQHVRDILPTVEVPRGSGPVRELPRAERDFDDLAVVGLDCGATSLGRFLEQTYTDGFLVLHDGAVVCERYLNGMDEATLHLSQSVAKSFVGMLAGIIARRRLVAVTAPVIDVLPEIAATAYEGATIRHLLDMTSGVRFREEYTDPFSDMGRSDVAAGWKPLPPGGAESGLDWPASIWDMVLSLRERDAEHGARFGYRSIETDVLAFVLERATGKPLAQLVSEELWQLLGMEQSGFFTVDPAGFALADGGLNACLRDYGRFGQMILDEGAGIVPASWIEATRNGDHALFKAAHNAVLPDGAYKSQFWIEDARSRNLMARGVFGQLIYIDFAHRMVVVKLSSWPEFTNTAWTVATLNAVRRIGEVLSRR
jgi:CubicO group peptidase (beta-lactamase class C family)